MILLFAFHLFYCFVFCETGLLVIAKWRTRREKKLRNRRIPTMTLKKRNGRLEHRRRVGRRSDNRILA